MTIDPRVLAEAESAQAHDQALRAAIPGFDALHQLATMILAEATGGLGRVLVVGAATGAECVALATACPALHVVGLESSDALLAIGESRVRDHRVQGRVRLYPSAVTDLPTFEPFDAALMLLVLHFAPDDGAKAELLTQLAARLKPGAPMVLADLFGPGWDDPAQAEQRVVWSHLQSAAGIDAESIAAGFAHIDHDLHPIPEPRLAELLAEAGFTPPRPFFRALCFGGWLTRRAGE